MAGTKIPVSNSSKMLIPSIPNENFTLAEAIQSAENEGLNLAEGSNVVK